MTREDLQNLVTEIIEETYKLKEKYITESIGVIDYVAIIPASIEQQKIFENLMLGLGVMIYSYPDASGKLFFLNDPLQTKFGEIKLITVRQYKSDDHRLGYLDFQTDNYLKLKEKYSQKKNFIVIQDDGWELFGVEEPQAKVAFYIPDNPLSQDSEVKKFTENNISRIE